MVNLQNRITILRKRARLSQTELGEKIGVTQGAVSLYEQGVNMPSRKALFALAALFDVTIGYLLGIEDEAILNPALPPLLQRMFEQHHLDTAAQVLMFTNGALTAAELDLLMKGGLPITIEEVRMVTFFREFDFDLVREYYKTARLSLPDEALRNPALPPLLQRMFEKHHLYTAAQALMFTNGALTASELDLLMKGGLPIAIEEARMVTFFRKFDFDLVREYYNTAHLSLPQAFEDLDAELRELVERVATSTDNSAEALEYVVALTKEIFARKGGEPTP